jgi:hypothetical protein
MSAPIITAASFAPKIMYAANPPVNVEAHRKMRENMTASRIRRILIIGRTPNCQPGEVQDGGTSFSRSGSLSPDDQRM